MAEEFGFFDPVEIAPDVWDREYNADQFTKYFKSLVSTGIMKGAEGELKVSAVGSNMITEIATGVAFIDGRYYSNKAKLAHTHDTETLGKDRIDRIVVRLDLNERWVKSFIKKGVASTAPVAPALTRTASVYEISLAQVKVIGGQTYISVANVTDERGKSDVCPYAGSRILPNFDDMALAELVDTVENMFSLTDGPYTRDLNAMGVTSVNDVMETGFYSFDNNDMGGIPGAIGDNRFLLSVLNDGKGGIAQELFRMYSSGLVRWDRHKHTTSDNWTPWSLKPMGLINTLNSTSTNDAATANAVKQVNDKLANIKVPTGGPIAIGTNSSVSAIYGSEIALGYSASVTGHGAIAIGYSSTAPTSQEGILGTTSSTTYGTHKWRVPGSFSVGGTKQFEIPHPHPEKRGTHILRHAAVESPTAGDTLYRYTLESLSDGETVTAQLPDYFEHLNKNVDVWVNGDGHFGRAYGKVIGDVLSVTCELAGSYKVLVIGTRNDDHESVQTWDIKGVEREIGESWTGETYSYEVDEIMEIQEITQGVI